VVLFLDAAHFLYGAYAGWLWCFVRIFLPSPSGRQRFNVLGALDAVTRQVHCFTNEGYINAESVCTLLRQVAEFYGPTLPITIFLDNARYQRCAWTQAQAQALGIELAFLPSYSPNLNLIERYWKWLKKECLNSRYHAAFAAMKTAVLRCLNQGHREHQAELVSLLTWNFHLFDKVTI
jgi:transposase